MKSIKGFTREGGGDLGNDPGVIDAAFSDEVLAASATARWSRWVTIARWCCASPITSPRKLVRSLMCRRRSRRS